MQKLGFSSFGLRLYFQVVSSSQKDFVIFKCYFSWTSQFFPVNDKDGKLGVSKTSLGCTSKFFPIHERVEKLGFLKSPLYPPLIFESFLLKQEDTLGTRLTNKQRILKNKKWFHSFRSSQLCSTCNVFVLSLVCRTNYILELLNIILSECWLTKNCRTIKISNQ